MFPPSFWGFYHEGMLDFINLSDQVISVLESTYVVDYVY